jgi:hypothetical protein
LQHDQAHYGYNFQEQFITLLPEEILYKRSFLILKKLEGDMKSDISRPDPTMLFSNDGVLFGVG